MKLLTTFIIFFFAALQTSAAQTVVVVRHAERADAGTGGAMVMATDPELSEAGRRRAEALAAALKDAGVTAIFATEYKRTQQTAAPLAKALGISVETVSSKNHQDLVARVEAAKGNVLVVGHSNTVPDVIKGLGVATPVTVGDAEYDLLFIVTLAPQPSVLRLHYR